jgi:chromosome segregation ATPase
MSAMHDDEGQRAAGAGHGTTACPGHPAAAGAGPETTACPRHAADARRAETADEARARLADLQLCAAEAYAEISLADDALRALARCRMTAERDLRLAAVRHHAAERAVAAHARARPGPAAQLATRFRARARWRQARPPLDAALADAERQLRAARRALSAVKRDFTARLAVRAAAAARLRRLTAECGAALARIAAADDGPPRENAASLRARDTGP